MFTIVVGNVGMVLVTDDYNDAVAEYAEWCKAIDSGRSRAESVFIMTEVDVVKEYNPNDVEE